MNKKYAVVSENGKTLVIADEYDGVMGRHVLRRSSFSDIRNFYKNRLVKVSGGGSEYTTTQGEYWLSHGLRRTLDSVVFAPGIDAGPQVFNLWRGFGVEPAPGDWSLLQAHIHENICRGNPDHSTYFNAWLANGVQHPSQQAETAVVLRGGQGSGKGTVGRCYARLFGQHAVHVSNGRHLTGNFNAHLQDAVFVFADEAFGIDDKAAIAVLKTLITERYIAIEAKYRDLTMAPNVIHLLIATNEAWAVPAGFDERRFFVLDVSSAQAQNTAYFRAIDEQMERGGYAAMLYDLQHLDLSQIDLRRVPVTEALQDQKRYSMSPKDRWWLDKLMVGRLLPDHDGWDPEVRTESVAGDCAAAMRTLGLKGGITPSELATYLKTRLPEPYPVNFQRTVEPDLPYEKKTRPHFWRFPALQECRHHFDQLMKAKTNWPAIEGEAASSPVQIAQASTNTEQLGEQASAPINIAPTQPAQPAHPLMLVSGERRPWVPRLKVSIGVSRP